MRGIQYAAALRFNHQRLWNTGSSAGACHRAAPRADPVADDDGRDSIFKHHHCRHSFAISPRNSREFFRKLAAPEIQRAQGMPGARRARSLACNVKKAYEHSHHGHAGNRPAFPAQWFYGLLRALPGVRILGCHRHRRIMVCQSPVGVTRLRKFSTSNGCQDHTTSPSASAPFVSAPEFAHGS
jgi:hypothetical protein